MDIHIRKSETNDSKVFQNVCFEAYRDAYVYEELGFTEDLLSREIFFNDSITSYFSELVTPAEGKFSYVAVVNNAVVGGVIVDTKDAYHISGFYVKPEFQGKGVGHRLWEQAETVLRDYTAKLSVHAHAYRAVNFYFKQGFVIDNQYPREVTRWDEWPKEKKFLTLCMIRPGSNLKTQTQPLISDKVRLYADGGSRGNPGPSAGGYVLVDGSENVITKNGKYLGITTNNQAEYHSLKGGLEMASQLGIKELDIYMDSLLVVNQMKGVYKIRNRDLWPIHESIKKLLPRFKAVTFNHIPRELNKLADTVVNETLDSHR